MSFYQEIQKYNWQEVTESISSKTSEDAKIALSKERLNLADFQALISPAAIPYLEIIAQKSMQVTQKRFGKTMQLYIPLYLSNSCNNTCTYCGFNHNNKFERKILTKAEVLAEARHIKEHGFEHVLLVTGEDNSKCNVDYIEEMMLAIKDEFSLISVEVQPLKTEEYKQLANAGLNSVFLYQETYNEANYKTYHPTGKKSDYKYRLEAPDRIGEAGVHNWFGLLAWAGRLAYRFIFYSSTPAIS